MIKNTPNIILVVLAFFAIYFIWGTTFLANLFGLEGMKPFVLTTFRYAPAGLLLAGWCYIKKISFPGAKDIKVLSISGVLMLVCGSGLIVVGQQYINSGHAAVVTATEPLLFLLLDKKNWKTYFSNKWIIAGLLSGFAGIVIFSYFTTGDNFQAANHSDVIKGTILVLLSAVFWVAGTLYAKNNTTAGTSNIANVAIQLIAAAVASAIIAMFLGEWKSFQPQQVSLQAWAGLLYLIIMGTLIAFIAFMWLVTIKPPAIVSTHTYVNPIVAVFMGWLMAKEELVAIQITGLGMVITGVILTGIKK